MFCGVGEEERTKFRKKKKEKKKEKNFIAAKSGLVGMKGYLKTYHHMKYFLPYLKIKCQEKFAILVLIATSKKVVQQQYFEFYNCLKVVLM